MSDIFHQQTSSTNNAFSKTDSHYVNHSITVHLYTSRSLRDWGWIPCVALLKEGKPFWVALIGAFVLALYGVVGTLQPSNFGRVYAAYGGILLLWHRCGVGKLIT